jgi:hypothetical protein
MQRSNRHRLGGPEIVQFIGLLIIIALICKHFGPGVHSPMTPSNITALVAGLFLLFWPMALKARS